MKIIDEEGMIFGRVNIIDALVVLFVGAIIISSWVVVFGPEDTEDTTEFTEVTVTVKIVEIEPYVAEAIETGRYSENLTVTKKSIEPAEVVVRNDEGEFHVREHPVLKSVTLQAEIRAKRGTEGIQFRGEPLRVGRKITLDSGRVIVKGPVTDILE